MENNLPFDAAAYVAQLRALSLTAEVAAPPEALATAAQLAAREPALAAAAPRATDAQVRSGPRSPRAARPARCPRARRPALALTCSSTRRRPATALPVACARWRSHKTKKRWCVCRPCDPRAQHLSARATFARWPARSSRWRWAVLTATARAGA